MIRIAARPQSDKVPAWHAAFLAMLPTIVRYTRMTFRGWPPEAREDAMQEVIANCLVAFARLAKLNKTDIAYPTVLARYAIAQVKEGRRVGSRHTIRDVLSPYCQREKHVTVERLDKYDPEEDAWQELIVEDKRVGPAEVAATRIDFRGWLRSLPLRPRRIAKFLANGETTGAAAQKFQVSAGRISQIRKELMLAWQTFVGDEPSPAFA